MHSEVPHSRKEAAPAVAASSAFAAGAASPASAAPAAFASAGAAPARPTVRMAQLPHQRDMKPKFKTPAVSEMMKSRFCRHNTTFDFFFFFFLLLLLSPRAYCNCCLQPRKATTNVVSIKLGTLEENALLFTGDPTFCQDCNAVYSVER